MTPRDCVNPMSNQFHVVAAKSELSEGKQLPVELDGEEILLCQHQNQYYAIANYCSHDRLSLEGGTFENGCIVCPYHVAEFNLEDGAVMAPPAYEGIKTYPIRVDADTLSVCATPHAAKPDE